MSGNRCLPELLRVFACGLQPAAPDVERFACTCKQPAAAVFRIFASEQPQQYACSMTMGRAAVDRVILALWRRWRGRANNDRLCLGKSTR